MAKYKRIVENFAIFEAIESERMDLLDEALNESSVNIDLEKSGETALHKSLNCFSSSFTTKLISRGADVNLANKEGVTPLLKAVSLNKCDMARCLIENGADVNIASNNGKTPLHGAVENNDFEMVSLLLYYGADTSCTSYPHILSDTNITCVLNPFELALNINADQSIKEVLSKYETFDCSLAAKPTLDKYLNWTIKENLEYLELLFSNECINDMIYYYCDFLQASLFSNLILSFFRQQLIEDELLPFICITLSSGIEVTSKDVQCLYECYGNNKILNLFLHTNIDFSGIMGSPLLNIICNVQTDMEEFLFRYCASRCKRYYSKPYYYHYHSLCELRNILDFHTPSKKSKEIIFQFLMYLNFVSSAGREKEMLTERINGLIMPSLIELSRDASKKTICEKYKIGNVYALHTVLNNLSYLPNYIKDIFKFKVPVNKT